MSATQEPVSTRNILAAAGMVFAWSGGFIGAELGIRAGGTPLMLLSWRMYVLTAVLGLVMLVRRAPWPSRRAWQRTAVVATFSQAGYLTLIFEGVHHGVSGGTAALIAAVQPLLVATVAGRALGEHTTVRMWLGMLVGLLGVGLVVSGDIAAGGPPASAYAYPVAGMLCLSIGTIIARRVRANETVLQSTFMQAAVTGVILGLLAAIVGEAAPLHTPDFWRSIAWMVLVPSLGGYALYMYVTHHMGATTVSTLLFLEAPTAMVWVWIMFGVPLTATSIAGLVVSAAGVVLVLQARRSRT